MSEAFGNPTGPGTGTETVREAYSFVCLNCGYGWEQEYEIGHRTTPEGRAVCEYRANGVRVPSPLTHPSCPGCGGEHVRIMGSGRVAHVDEFAQFSSAAAVHRETWIEHESGSGQLAPRRGERGRRRFRIHLPFHFHLRRGHGTPES